MERKVTCPICKGKGWYPYPGDPSAKRACNMCARKGQIILTEGSEICDRCNGWGMVWIGERTQEGCDKCGGKGIIKLDEFRRY